MAKRKLKINDFIEQILIQAIGAVVEDDHHYLAFALISHGIELLGAIVEEDHALDYDSQGTSRTRFKNGLQLMNDPRYDHYCPDSKKREDKYDLYTHLRCGFAHQLRPTGYISLTHAEESIREKTTHLELKEDERLVLDVDKLYVDFKEACEKVISKINNKEISHDKAYQNFLSIDVDGPATNKGL